MGSLQVPRCLSFLQHKQRTSVSHLKQIHAQLLTNGLKSPPILAQLIENYCALHATSHAHLLLLTHSEHPNVYLLNVLMRCTGPRDSFRVFSSWVSKAGLAFDDFTFLFALGACARQCNPSALCEGQQVHARVIKHGFWPNIMLQTTAIHFYGSNKDVGSARRVFDEMSLKNSVTWNAMIKGYCSQKVKLSQHALTALILFKDMLVDLGGVKPTDTTMVCVLSAASRLGALETGTCVHGYIEKTIYAPQDDVFLGTGLVDMYSKCGCLDTASYLFSTIKEKDVFTWTAMSTGLAIHGRAKEALVLLDDMEGRGIKPNAVTFTSLFYACCHAGLVEDGLCLFHNMESKFGVKPRIHHYGCVVDLLGRAGHLEEAYMFIEDLGIKADTVLWKSLLNACKVHDDVVIGEKVGKILLRLQPEKGLAKFADLSEDYIALSNFYASAERWKDAEMVRDEMKGKGIQLMPGCSSVS